jgi:exonuclease III
MECAQERVYTGMIILIKKEVIKKLQGVVVYEKLRAGRLSCINMTIRNRTLTIGTVYMPADNTIKDKMYRTRIQNDINQITDRAKYMKATPIILGDWNTTEEGAGSRKETMEWLQEQEWISITLKYKHTFEHRSIGTKYRIDMIMTNTTVEPYVIGSWTNDIDHTVSDHTNIGIKLNYQDLLENQIKIHNWKKKWTDSQ